jgi:hypothetical protein
MTRIHIGVGKDEEIHWMKGLTTTSSNFVSIATTIAIAIIGGCGIAVLLSSSTISILTTAVILIRTVIISNVAFCALARLNRVCWCGRRSIDGTWSRNSSIILAVLGSSSTIAPLAAAISGKGADSVTETMGCAFGQFIIEMITIQDI